jgi:integrase
MGRISLIESRQQWRIGAIAPGTDKVISRFVSGTRTETEGKLHDLQIRLLSPTVSDQITVEEFLLGWLAEREPLVGKNLPVTNFNSYKRAVDNVLPHLGKMKLTDLRPAHVKRMLQSLADSGQGRSTVTQTKTNLQKMLRYAIENHLIESNPAQTISMKDDINARSAETATAMIEEQVAALREAMEGDWMEPMILIGLNLGPRPGELLGLQWRYLNYATEVLRIRRSLNRVPQQTLADGTIIRSR